MSEPAKRLREVLAALFDGNERGVLTNPDGPIFSIGFMLNDIEELLVPVFAEARAAALAEVMERVERQSEGRISIRLAALSAILDDLSGDRT